MKTKRFFLFKVFALLCLSILLLNSCGKATEAPEDVIQKFKQQATEVKSADISVKAVINGTDAQDVIDATSDMNFRFDLQNPEDKKVDIQVSLGGMLKTAEQSLDGNIDFTIRTIGSSYYILLNKLESNSENMQTVLSVLSDYIGKWLHIADEFIPENVREFQQKDEAALAKQEQLKQLFIGTDLFTVTKEYGTETVNGQKVYHYGIQFSEAGIQEYTRKAAVIDGRELTETEIKEASKVVSYITGAEFWIGVSDYNLYKAVVSLSGPVTDGKVSMNASITVKGSDYNKTIKIVAPADAQEFNPFELLMAYSAANATVTESDSAEAADEDTEDQPIE